MGDRANYAILNRGKLSIFYAHWGGPTVPRELTGGPAACERFIRAQERVRSKELLDFTYMLARKVGEGWEVRRTLFSSGSVIHHGARILEGV